MTDLFSTAAEVTAATNAGIEMAFDGAGTDWKATATAEVEYLSRTLDEFTTDEVIARLELHGAPPDNLMALGSIMRRAASAGWIENSGRRRRTKIKRRHRELTVWRSLR